MRIELSVLGDLMMESHYTIRLVQGDEVSLTAERCIELYKRLVIEAAEIIGVDPIILQGEVYRRQGVLDA